MKTTCQQRLNYQTEIIRRQTELQHQNDIELQEFLTLSVDT
jgi:hypothetical protein